MKLALLLVAVARVASADPPSQTPPAPEPSPVRCTDGPFVDVMLGGTSDGVFHRVSAGYALRTCDYALAIGANFNAAAAQQNAGTDGVGLNIEPSLRTSDLTRLGLFMSYDFNDYGRRLYSAELRLHTSDVFWFEAGIVHLTPEAGATPKSETLALFGVGVEGKAGWYAGGVELVLAGLAFALIAHGGGIGG